jgi:hypothetical protein
MFNSVPTGVVTAARQALPQLQGNVVTRFVDGLTSHASSAINAINRGVEKTSATAGSFATQSLGHGTAVADSVSKLSQSINQLAALPAILGVKEAKNVLDQATRIGTAADQVAEVGRNTSVPTTEDVNYYVQDRSVMEQADALDRAHQQGSEESGGNSRPNKPKKKKKKKKQARRPRKAGAKYGRRRN